MPEAKLRASALRVSVVKVRRLLRLETVGTTPSLLQSTTHEAALPIRTAC